MRRARHLGGIGSQRFALVIGIVAIASDVALVFGLKAVVASANCDLDCHPERSPQSHLAELRQFRLTAEMTLIVGVSSAKVGCATPSSRQPQTAPLAVIFYCRSSLKSRSHPAHMTGARVSAQLTPPMLIFGIELRPIVEATMAATACHPHHPSGCWASSKRAVAAQPPASLGEDLPSLNLQLAFRTQRTRRRCRLRLRKPK